MAFSITEEEFYAHLSERHGEKLQEKLRKTTVAICGLGGLGSNIAISLARMGVGKLILIDMDEVDIKNIHRQQYKLAQVGMLKTEALRENLAEINPFLKIDIINTRVTTDNAASLLKEADIVCEAFDNPNAKAMLVDVVVSNFPEKYLVAASGMAGKEDANLIRTRRITDHFYLCGDESSDVATAGTLFASRVMVCAAHQAHMVVQIIDSL